MRKILLVFILILSLCSSNGKAQIISQYIETSSGTSPKGIEIWNNTGSTLNFSTNNLVIEKGTNGAAPTPDYTLNSGTLASGAVIVIGTSDMQTFAEANGAVFYLKAFSFNGDDALVVKYGGTITDVFGDPGTGDPGTGWAGSGVQTYNQNISIKAGITTGDLDGWTDPSLQFETTSTDNSLTGFGIAPVAGGAPAISALPTSLSGFNYVVTNGPSTSQSFDVSGSNLTNDIIITAPASYEISTDDVTFQSTPITLTQTGGTVASTTIHTQLIAGLATGDYTENIILSTTGGSNVNISCSGRVDEAQTTTIPYSQDFSSDFGKIYTYDGGGDDNWYITGGYVVCNGYPNTDAVDDDWMILPGVDFSAYTNVQLSFDLWWQFGNQDVNNYLKLWYSTNYIGYGNPAAATWQELTFAVPASDQTWETTGPINLSSITASSVYIAFEYYSDDAARAWQIDNILLQEGPSSPTINISPASLTGMDYEIGNGPSASQSFNVSGSSLTNDITVTPPLNYELSIDNATFLTTAFSLTQTAGTVPPSTLYVRLKSALPIDNYNGDIVLTSTGATNQTVNCDGNVTAVLVLPTAWINEIHYDNTGADVDEMIEVLIKNASGYNLSDFTVTLYNGGDGALYDTKKISTFTVGDVNGDYSFYYLIYPVNGIQNGPDGIALDWNGNLIQFIAYEGTFKGVGGPADGVTAQLINTWETSAKPVGSSIQLVGTGEKYTDFTWVDPVASPGSLNANQFFGFLAPPVPIDFRYILLIFVAIGGTLLYRFYKK